MTQLFIHTVADLGRALRATRNAQRVRLDDMAGAAHLSHVFAANVEHGKDTVQLGKVLQLLREAGLTLSLELSQEAWRELDALRGHVPIKSARRKQPSPKTASKNT